MKKRTLKLLQKYLPSKPCTCDTCVQYCRRPGWWTVDECRKLITRGMAGRMMLEMSPDLSFGVLSPAFKGNEGFFAVQEFAGNWCTFFIDQRCALFGSGLQPLECRYCHHERNGSGSVCHRDIERNWNSSAGQRLVHDWMKMMNGTII